MRAGALALFLASATAQAADPDVTLKIEAGSEVDSNVHRAPSGSNVQSAADGRFGVHLDLLGKAGEHGRYALDAVAAGKAFAGRDASTENVAVTTFDGRYDLDAGLLVPGIRLAYYEAFGDVANVLALRTGDAGASLALHAGELRVAPVFGWRFFTYKPDRAFDFDGPHVGLSIGQRVRAEDASWQLAWAAAYSASVRRYGAAVLANFCGAGAPVTPSCLSVTTIDRTDLFHDVAVDLTYTGAFILGLRLGLQVNESNSFGQSLVRGRVELSGTAELVWDIVVTARVILQVDSYVDGLLLGGDVGTFTTIEDEARNAVILHVTRDLSDSWALEARLAAYANPFAAEALAYRRETAYLGLVYSFRAPR